MQGVAYVVHQFTAANTSELIRWTRGRHGALHSTARGVRTWGTRSWNALPCRRRSQRTTSLHAVLTEQPHEGRDDDDPEDSRAVRRPTMCVTYRTWSGANTVLDTRFPRAVMIWRNPLHDRL